LASASCLEVDRGTSGGSGHRAFGKELRRLRELTVRVADEEDALDYDVGTMIEPPRARVRADEVAEPADFFSFGTGTGVRSCNPTNGISARRIAASDSSAVGSSLGH
jgi:hypothetical protein